MNSQSGTWPRANVPIKTKISRCEIVLIEKDYIFRSNFPCHLECTWFSSAEKVTFPRLRLSNLVHDDDTVSLTSLATQHVKK